MLKKRLLGGLCLLLAAMFCLSGCGGNEANENNQGVSGQAVITGDETSSTTGSDVSIDKDTMIFAMTSEPPSLEPGASTDNFITAACAQFYETMFRLSAADRSVAEPLLCDSYEWTNEGKTLLFKIKEGVKFHDGSILSAEDVAYSLNRAITMPANAGTSSVMIDAVVVDDTHVALNLQYPYEATLKILCNPAYSIVSKDYFENASANGVNISTQPMGTGAYKFVQWDSGSKIIGEAFEDWHGGEVAIKSFEIRILMDTSSASIALEDGQVDALLGVSGADLPRLRENPEVSVLSAESAGLYYVSMNAKSDLFSDVRVRQAVSCSINKEELLYGAFDGVGWTRESMIPSPYFGFDPEFKANQYDIEKAKALIEEAGATGKHVVIKCINANEYSLSAQVLQEQLRLIGLDSEVQIMERANFVEEVYNKCDYDICVGWRGGTYADADAIVWGFFNSDSVGFNNNIANVDSPTVDELLLKARTSVDTDERFALYQELNEINNENCWYIPIVQSTCSLCVNQHLKGAYAQSFALYKFNDFSW